MIKIPHRVRGARLRAALVLAAASAAASCGQLAMVEASQLDRAKDGKAPSIAVSSPSDGFVCANIVEVRGNVSDETGDGRAGRLDSLSYEVPGSAISGSVLPAADGSFVFRFATDALGTAFSLSIKAVDWNANATTTRVSLKKDSASSLPGFAVEASSRKVVLTWDPVPNSASYDLYYSDTGSLPSESVGTKISGIASPYTLKCTNGRLYVFRLKAKAEAGYPDSYSDYLKTIPLSSGTLAPKLYGMRGRIDLRWNGIPATDQYTILRRVGDVGTFDEFRTTTGTSFSDTTVQNGRNYYYKIRPKEDCAILSASAGGQTDGFGTSPTLTSSSVLDDARSFARKGGYLYGTSAQYGLRVFDVSAPTIPKLVRSVALPAGGLAYEVAVSGDYAYVAAGKAGILVYDISSPASPVLAATYATGITCARGLAFYGTKLLATDFSYNDSKASDVTTNYGRVSFYTCTLSMLDVATPSNPVLLKTFAVNAGPERIGYGLLGQDSVENHLPVAVYGDHALVADLGGGIRVVRLTDASGSPAIQTLSATDRYPTATEGAYAKQVAVSGSAAYVAYGHYGIMVIDLSGLSAGASASIVSCDDYLANGRAQDLAISAPWLYVANYDRGIQIYRIDEPLSPSPYKSIAADYPSTVAAAGSILYSYTGLYTGSTGQQIIDTNQPLELGFRSKFQSTSAFDIALDGSRAYLADGSSGLRVLDVSDPAAPSQAGILAFGGYVAAKVKVHAQLAFVLGSEINTSSSSANLFIVDVSDPAKPALRGKIGTDYVRGFDASGDYFYLSTLYHGLEVYDISSPASPTLLCSILTGNSANALSVSGSYAYLADSGGSVKVFDIANPASTYLASTITAFGCTNIATSASGAFIGSSFTGLGVLDIADPLAGSITKTFAPAAAMEKGLAWSGNYLFGYQTPNPYSPGMMGTVRIIDLSRIGKPLLISSCPAAFDYDSYSAGGPYGAGNGLAVQGAYLYSATGVAGLYVYGLRP